MACKLSAIVAVSDDWGIGYEGDMIVSNRADMKHFVACTTGHPVIMGRKTLDSFPGGRPLKNRRNIVLTRDAAFAREGVEVVHSVDEALAAVADEEEAWVIGGEEIYRQLLPQCAVAVVTKTHCLRLADTHFPNLDEDDDWEVASESDTALIGDDEEDAGIEYRFVTYRRRSMADQFAEPADNAEPAAGTEDGGVRIRTMILYRSKHHGNTKRVVDAIAAAFPDDVDTLDIAKVDKKHPAVDLRQYHLVGVASGIYHGEIDHDLARVLQASLGPGEFVFGLLTYGGASKWYGKDIDGICRAKQANFLAGHGCPGLDTWGPYKLMGGMNKGRPNEEDLADMVSWYRELVNGYGAPLINEYEKRRRREAWDAAHPDPTLVDKLKNTGRHLFGRKRS